MNYTAIGDAVNLASRLEGQNKQYGTTIIASEAIVQEVGDEFVFRLLDRVAVKGKSEAIRIYELLGRKGEAAELRDIPRPRMKKLSAAFNFRQRAFRRRHRNPGAPAKRRPEHAPSHPLPRHFGRSPRRRDWRVASVGFHDEINAVVSAGCGNDGGIGWPMVATRNELATVS